MHSSPRQRDSLISVSISPPLVRPVEEGRNYSRRHVAVEHFSSGNFTHHIAHFLLWKSWLACPYHRHAFNLQDGICFLETANLDGETNLKQRRVYVDVSFCLCLFSLRASL